MPEKIDKKHPERNEKLHAAAGKHTSAEYVREFTKKMRHMASVLGNTKILVRLGSIDVRAAELFYHSSCHCKLINEYNRATQNVDNIISGQPQNLETEVAFAEEAAIEAIQFRGYISAIYP